MSLEVIDQALREFSTRHAVPADTIIDLISTVDPVCAEELSKLVSKVKDSPGVLHIRDALNPLLDLRNAFINKVTEPDSELEPA